MLFSLITRPKVKGPSRKVIAPEIDEILLAFERGRGERLSGASLPISEYSQLPFFSR